jgi:hypothetical protein
MSPTYTGISSIDFVIGSCGNLLNSISNATGLSFTVTTALTLFVAWPLASFVLLKTVFRNKKETNELRCITR